MVCEAFGGGVFTYVSQLCNDMVDEFDVYLAYSLRPQTPKNYTDFLDQRVHLIEMENVGVKGLTNLKSDIAAIKELRQIEKDVQPDVIHLHSSVAGGLKRRKDKEIPFCELPEIFVENFAVWDDYETDYTIFSVCGIDIRVLDDELAEALKKLPERKRNTLLMYYFLEMTESEIANLQKITQSGVFRNRHHALETMKKILKEKQ